MDVLLDPDLEQARAGDDAAFGRLVVPLRPELHAHCYRMLGSVHDADDALQNALVQAWRGLGGFTGRGSLRSWLYTVATRCCLDAIAVRGRRALPIDLGPASPHVVAADAPRTDIAWLTPYLQPDAYAEQREAVELAFVATLQHLPGNQRAALLLFEVLDLSAAEIAEVMQTSVASVNSARQRARATLAERMPDRDGVLPDRQARAAADEFADALERGDADALIALLSADVSWAMPPLPAWYAGLPTVTAFARDIPFGSCGAWRVLPVVANGGPALALYLRAAGLGGLRAVVDHRPRRADGRDRRHRLLPRRRALPRPAGGAVTVQPGVLAVGATEHCYLEFDALGGDLLAELAPLVALPTTAGVNVVVGVRPSRWSGEIATDWTDDLVGPDGFTMPATPHDAWVWLSGSDRSAVFDATRSVIAALAPVARLASEIVGWVYQHDRDLTGFIDGTENPTAVEAPAVAATPEGTSVVLYQLWTHDAAAWDTLPDKDQERAMGRTKPDSVELDPLPESSHVARTVIEVDGEELDIFRRNVAYGGPSDHGTVFVGFSHDQWRMAEMLRRMAGVGDGIRCALTHYLTPTTGAYYVVPSVEALLPHLPATD